VKTNIKYGTEISLAMSIYEQMDAIKKNIKPDKIQQLFDTRVGLDTVNAALLVALNVLIIVNTA
jgi:hypothetical protein